MKLKGASKSQLLAFVLCLCLPSALVAQQNIPEPIPNSCEAWTSDRNARQSQARELWVIGYLGGTKASDADNPNFLNGMDGNAIFAWIDNYCKAKPPDNLVTALLALARELKDRADRK